MKQEHKDVNKILPYGELLRGFANQSYLVKSDLKRFLRNRGVFLNTSDKEKLVPCISTLILSPKEFDDLREYQNTKEDNFKKNSSRLNWNSTATVTDAIKHIDLTNVLPKDGINYYLTKEPSISLNKDEKNIVKIEFEIERNDLNKSFYESTNRFTGEIEIRKISESEIKITKSYTSSESNAVADSLIKIAENHFKAQQIVKPEQELRKILFGDFTNEDRIVFFYRLSSNMENSHFKFKDIVDMDFKPDNSESLPAEIEWMSNKSELKLRGKQIHDTFFIKESKYNKNLQFWEMESSYDFKYALFEGSCNLVFSFKNFQSKGNLAEFEINISNFNLNNSSDFSNKEKLTIKNKLLLLFENQKDVVYSKFLTYLESKNAVASTPIVPTSAKASSETGNGTDAA